MVLSPAAKEILHINSQKLNIIQFSDFDEAFFVLDFSVYEPIIIQS